jgi:hypothetical protein
VVEIFQEKALDVAALYPYLISEEIDLLTSPLQSSRLILFACPSTSYPNGKLFMVPNCIHFPYTAASKFISYRKMH